MMELLMASRTGSLAEQSRASVCNRKCRIRQPQLRPDSASFWVQNPSPHQS